MSNQTKHKPRGFAVIPKDIGRKIASMGGKAVSKNRDWMRALGRKGGQAKRERKNEPRD